MESFKLPSSIENVFESSYGTKRLSKSEIRSGLQDVKPAMSKGSLMDQTTFDILCNTISRFESLELSLKQTSLDIIKKAGNNCSKQFGKLLCFEAKITTEDKQKYLKVLNQTIYILINLSTEVYQESTKKNILLMKRSRSKKVSTGIDVETELQSVIRLIMSILDLNISKLWENRLVDDAFVNLLEKFFYNLLEDQQLVNDKTLKLLIFEALGCLVKRFGQNVNTEFKVVQMLQNFEHISSTLAEALFVWTDKFKFLSLLPRVLRELDLFCEDDLVKDVAVARSISNFITELGKLLPNQLLANIDLLLDRLGQEPYSIRNSVVDCIREILLHILCKEDADEKSRSNRDEFIELLFEHANLDKNAFVRSRAVNSLVALVKAESFPIKRSHNLVDLGVKLLLDKSGFVRKAALQLLAGLLTWNPFGANLTVKSLEENLEKAEEKLKELQKDLPAKMEPEEEKEDEGEDEDEDKIPDVIEEEKSAADCLVNKQKEVVNYFSMAYGFVKRFNDASHLLSQLLLSKTQSDVLESIQFFKVAFEFNLDFVIEGIDTMVHQIFSEDQKVRDAVVSSYTEMFFQNPTNSSRSINPLMIVKNLTSITKRVTSASASAFQCLLTELQKNQVIPPTAIQIIWDKLSSSSNEDINEIKLIFELISILAHKNPEMLQGKLNLLVKVGLRHVEQQNGYHDFQLAEVTCTVLSKVATPSNSSKKSLKYSHGHLVMKSILDLVVKGFPLKSNNYIKFVNESIAVLINLSESPFKIIKQLFNSIYSIVSSSEVDSELLTRLFSISGTLALKAFVYVDCEVQADLNRKKSKSKRSKKRDKPSRKKRQNKSQVGQDDEEDEADTYNGQDHQDFINQIIENEIVGPKTLLGSISRLLVQACSETELVDEASIRLQSASTLTLSKYMTVSMKFCEKHLCLFFTLLEKSPHENIRANLVICASDLYVRFPNLLEPWTIRLYSRLNDESELVRIYTLKVLTNLILIEMIKVKGQVSEIARCIVDKNTKLSSIAKNFFYELSKKGNSLYNIVPDIISRLSGSDSNLGDDDYRVVMTFIFNFISMDRQVESLMEKICHRFKATRDEDQLRKLAFCLTLLPYSEKCFKKLVACCPFYIDSLGDAEIFDSFQIIILKTKTKLKQDVKEAADEFEGKLTENHARLIEEKKSDAKAAAAVAECSNINTPENKTASRAEKVKQSVKKNKIDFSSSGESDEDDVSGGETKSLSSSSVFNLNKNDFMNEENENFEEEENEADKSVPDQNHTPIRRRKSQRNKSLLQD